MSSVQQLDKGEVVVTVTFAINCRCPACGEPFPVSHKIDPVDLTGGLDGLASEDIHCQCGNAVLDFTNGKIRYSD